MSNFDEKKVASEKADPEVVDRTDSRASSFREEPTLHRQLKNSQSIYY
jgi:hypothetical protein